MNKYRVKLNVYIQGGTATYEVMESVNLPTLVPGKCFHVDENTEISAWIYDSIGGDIKPEEVDIILKHGHESTVIRIKDPIEITNSQYGSFEIRHDHAGAFSGLDTISQSLDDVARAIDEKGEADA